MVGIDFDFARYVAQRKGQIDQRAREGAAYSYSGARKVRRTLSSARPVTLALEATNRLWKSAAKNDLLGTCVRVTDQQFPNVYAQARLAAGALGIDHPTVYVSPARSRITASTLGTDDEPYIVINTELAERLDDDELRSLLGHECGHIQNNHVVYVTALHYLQHSAISVVRWAVQPAIMALQAWSRRAEITCDRAALVCSRDLHVTFNAMMKIELGLERAPAMDIDAYLEQLPDTKRGIGRYGELFRSHPYLPKRVQALKLFSESGFYRRLIGEDAAEGATAEQVDEQVSQILSVF